MEGWSINNWIQLIITLSGFAVGFGSLKQKIENMGGQFERLERKQEEHNGFMRRMAVMENAVQNNTSTCAGISSRLLGVEKDLVRIEANVKSNQHRIDDLER